MHCDFLDFDLKHAGIPNADFDSHRQYAPKNLVKFGLLVFETCFQSDMSFCVTQLFGAFHHFHNSPLNLLKTFCVTFQIR